MSKYHIGDSVFLSRLCSSCYYCLLFNFCPCITHQEELISACYMLLILLDYVCYVYFVIIILFVISFNVQYYPAMLYLGLYMAIFS